MKKVLLFVLSICLMAMPAFADRPLITDDTITRGQGNVQIEVGLSLLCDKDNVDEQTSIKTRGGEVSVGIIVGLIDTIDIILGTPYLWNRINDNVDLVYNERGLSDATIDFKWRFFEKTGWTLAIKPGIRLPTGNENKGLGSGRVGHRLFFIGTKEFGAAAVHANLGYIRNENIEGERKDIWHTSLAAELEILFGLKLSANIGAEKNSFPGDNSHPAFFLGGIAYKLHKKVTLDAGVKYGLNSPETDWTFVAGITMNF